MDLHGLWSRLTGGRAGANPGVKSGSATSDALPSPATGRHAAWRSLPPIAPAARPAPLVAQRSPFEPGLGGAAPTPLALAPLGHERSLEAPAGLVAAVHAPVVARSADLLPTSVRPGGHGRRREHAASAEPAGLAWPGGPEVPGDEPVPLPALEPAPSRPAPVIARSVTAPLTVAPAVETPGGFVGAPPPAESVPAPTVARSLDAVASSASPLPAEAPAGPPPGAPAPPAVGVTRSPVDHATASAPAEPLVARRNLGQSRRLRIGPAIEPVTRAATGMALSPALQRAVEATPDPMPQLPPDLPVERRVEPSEAASAGRSVARSIAGHAADSADRTTRDSPDAEPPDGIGATEPAPPAPRPEPVFLRPAADERPTFAPLLGTLRPTFDSASPAVAIGRVVEDDEPGAAPTGVAAALAALNAPGSLPVADAGQTVARLADTAGGGSTGRGGPRTGGPGGGVGGSGGWGGERGGRAAARSQAGDGGETARPGRSAAVGTASAPVLARSVAWDVPSGSVVSPFAPAAGTRSLHARPDAPTGGTARLRVGSAVARSVARDAGVDESAFLPEVAAGQPVAPSAGDAPPATVLRAVADPGDAHDAADSGIAAFPGAGVQRAAGDAAPAAGPAPTGAPGAAGAGGPTSGPELDALAARLYERIRLRLRRELLADRERAGVLVDMGH